MTLHAAFRADASAEMGTGHFMRSLTLARAWRAAGGESLIMTATDNQALFRRAQVHSVPLLRLGHGDDGLKATGQWAAENLGSWVCLDGYQFGEEYQSVVSRAGARVMVIDDYVRLPRYHANLLLDQNFGAEARLYPLDLGASVLLGPRYALLAPEFRRAISPNRRHEGDVKRILVTLGGADPGGQTSKVAEALLGLRDFDVEAVFVMGAANVSTSKIEDMVRGRSGFRVVRDATDMPALMSWADLAVTATGTTSWELCAMGVSSVALVLADNQRPGAEALASAGVFVNLGWYECVTKSAIADAVAALSHDPHTRQEMARRGQALVDGIGADRVVQEMMSPA